MEQGIDSEKEMERLNRQFGTVGVSFQSGRNNLITVRLEWEGNAAVVYLLGAHLTSWQGRESGEHLFVSRESLFESGKAIRGGIPICFPQFGLQGPLVHHGFARINLWSVQSTEYSPSGVSIVLELDDNDAHLWPGKPTRTLLQITLNDSLALEMTVHNLGTEVIELTHAFHNYFRISSIENVVVEGLNGTSFLDKVKDGEVSVETRDLIHIESETDRVYLNAPDRVEVLDHQRQLAIQIEKSHQQDVVVWNPWAARAQALKDFGDDEYRRMIAVESGNISAPVCVGAGASLVVEQVLSVRKISG